jgi:hypothetical protein
MINIYRLFDGDMTNGLLLCTVFRLTHLDLFWNRFYTDCNISSYLLKLSSLRHRGFLHLNMAELVLEF